MIKFALYYIPPYSPFSQSFYQVGSRLLGYDIYEKSEIEETLLFEGYSKDHALAAKEYGFHLTIGDALYLDSDDLPLVRQEIKSLLSVLDPAKEMKLTARPNEHIVQIAGQQKNVLVARYEANLFLHIFHALVVARLHPLGKGSLYTEQIAKGKFPPQPEFLAHRLNKFYTYTGLDHYMPHFTLLNPVPYDLQHEILPLVRELVEPHCPSEIVVDNFYLVVQKQEGGYFEILEHFRRKGT